MRLRREIGLALLGIGLVVTSCGIDRHSVPAEAGAAATRIAELRARFHLPEADRAGVHAAHRAARVELPMRAADEVRLEDETSRLSLRFALEHMHNTPIERAAGMALYRGALDGADVVHRVHAEGTEDFVIFETRPAREELTYSVDVSRVPGLRLVSNTLEFLDETGTPLLRVAPPYVVESTGRQRNANLAVSGCAYDTSPAGPWGRKVTAAGAARCTVRVTWPSDIAYPAMVDPAWTSTGSMATARSGHTSSVLPSGKVLVAGGCTANCKNSPPLASAELFDAAGNAGAGTFAATGSMVTARTYHTATVLPSGKVLVAGGSSAGNFLASAELFDAAGNAGAGTFATTGPMTTERSFHTASALASGLVVVAGGTHAGAGGHIALASAELFDPAGNGGAGAFTATGSLGNARMFHTASVLPSGLVLVAGGEGLAGASLASAELFDPAGNAGSGSFAGTASLATARDSHTASVLPTGKVLLAGGYRGGATFGDILASAELFDPAGNAGAGSITATGSLVTARQGGFTASVLPSGKVLIAGGYTTGVNGGVFASTELYDPAADAGAGSFSAAGSMTNLRLRHAASVLPSGKVLVTGGEGDTLLLASAELFDPTAGNACTTDGSCGSNDYCAPSTTCQPRKASGTACNVVAGCNQPGCRECASGFCVDGVCCDKACTGQCEACAPPPAFGAGKCNPVSGAPKGGRPPCATGLTCNGANVSCGPPAPTCDGDHTTTAVDGTKHDCAPYKCGGAGACLATCLAVGCVAPAICDGTGKCVAPSPAADSGLPPADATPAPGDGSSGGGCSVVSVEGREEHWPIAWLAAAAGLALARRKRVTPRQR
jgi:hypothetical protein